MKRSLYEAQLAKHQTMFNKYIKCCKKKIKLTRKKKAEEKEFKSCKSEIDVTEK